MKPQVIDREFERWWSLQKQTIGKVAARAAWDYQQVRITVLKATIEELKS